MWSVKGWCIFLPAASFSTDTIWQACRFQLFFSRQLINLSSKSFSKIRLAKLLPKCPITVRKKVLLKQLSPPLETFSLSKNQILLERNKYFKTSGIYTRIRRGSFSLSHKTGSRNGSINGDDAGWNVWTQKRIISKLIKSYIDMCCSFLFIVLIQIRFDQTSYWQNSEWQAG